MKSHNLQDKIKYLTKTIFELNIDKLILNTENNELIFLPNSECGYLVLINIKYECTHATDYFIAFAISIHLSASVSRFSYLHNRCVNSIYSG